MDKSMHKSCYFLFHIKRGEPAKYLWKACIVREMFPKNEFKERDRRQNMTTKDET